MVASAARIEANRANAQKSTGPKTPDGKEKSRANAVKHGLCSTVVGMETLEPVGDTPNPNLASWLGRQVGSLSGRVEHAQEMQEAVRDRIALRAHMIWEDDRRLEAIILGDQIAQRPEEIVERLRETPQGCDWLITRWAMLAHAADQGPWTPEQSSLALDLLGSPLDFRQGYAPGTEVDAEGFLTGQPMAPAALARSKVKELLERRELVEPMDTLARQTAQAGLSDDAELRRLRRYELSLQRQLRWSLDLLEQLTAQSPAEPSQPSEPSEPSPEASSSETAAIDRSELPRRSTTRAEKKLDKAKARREARERKLEKLRA